MYCAFVYHHFQNSQKDLRFITHPILTSMFRMRSKVMANSLKGRMDRDMWFCTLTVDDKHYDQVFNNPEMTGSQLFSRYLTRLRNYLKRGSLCRGKHNFEYIWRIERGSQSSRRLHFHFLVKSSYQNLRSLLIDTWEFCDWAKLEQSSFDETKVAEPITNRQVAEIYLSKYVSKVKGCMNMAQAKQDLKCRLYSTARYFKNLLPYEKVSYLPDQKAWELGIKDNWAKIKDPFQLSKVYSPFFENHPDGYEVVLWEYREKFTSDEKLLGYYCYDKYERVRSVSFENEVERKQRSNNKVIHPVRIEIEKLLTEECEQVEEKEALLLQAESVCSLFQTSKPYYKKRHSSYAPESVDFEDTKFHNRMLNLDNYFKAQDEFEFQRETEFYYNDEFRFPSIPEPLDFDWMAPKYYSN